MPQQSETAHQKTVSLVLVYCLIFAPFVGCSKEAAVPELVVNSGASAEMTIAEIDSQNPTQDTGVIDQAWQFVTETTTSGLTIVSDGASAGTDMVLDASEAAWIWSADTTANGWEWISANAGDATQWASDGLGNTWTITKQTGGEFSLWVQVKANNGIAWARTELPEAWKVVKDSAGDAWIWIDDHKIEVAVAAAVVAVVVAALLIAPEGVAGAIARGAAGGASAEGTKFLTATWNQRETSKHGKTLKEVSKDLFLSLGKSVIAQCGGQIVNSLPVPGA